MTSSPGPENGSVALLVTGDGSTPRPRWSRSVQPSPSPLYQMIRLHPVLRWRRGWILAALFAAPASAAGQTLTDPVPVGRWNLAVASPDRMYPSWLEITRSGRETLVGRFVGASGSVRPISRVDFADGILRFSIPPQWERGAGDLHVEGRLEGDRLTGVLLTPSGERHRWTATRAPFLRRMGTPDWGDPVAVFNGRDLSGWTAAGDGESRWRVVDGVLVNSGAGANLVSTRSFEDFKLHVEFRYPPGSNSGIYLRGRYEVQIEDSPERPEPGLLDHAAVYGFLAPTIDAALGANEWQTFDITLIGRRVTVILNGQSIIADRVIPGITGGALDGDEGEPGPILLQGDHGPVEFRTIELTPARYHE
jgi:hypothetical protein